MSRRRRPFVPASERAMLTKSAIQLVPPREPPHLQDCAGPGCGASCTCWLPRRRKRRSTIRRPHIDAAPPFRRTTPEGLGG